MVKKLKAAMMPVATINPRSIIILAFAKGTPIARSKRKIRSKRQDKAKEAIQRIFGMGNDKNIWASTRRHQSLVFFSRQNIGKNIAYP